MKSARPLKSFALRAVAGATTAVLLVSGCRERPPSVPEIRMPPVTTYSAAPALAWTWPDGADHFEVEMAGDALFTMPVLKDTTPVRRYVAPNGLPAGDYYWRAFAVRDGKRLPGEASGMLSVRTPDNIYEVPAGAGLDEILAVVHRAAANTPARVVFPAMGNFRLPAGAVFLDLKGVRQLVIDGRGSSITFLNPLTGFARMSGCEEVSFCDFVINNEPPPFTVGIITSVDKETGLLTFDVVPGHPDFDAPHIISNWSFAMFLEPEPAGRILDDSPLVPGIKKETLRRTGTGFSAEANNPGQVRMVEAGDRIVQFSRSPGGQSLFACQNSSDLAFLRIVNHAISGGHYQLLECDSARILKCSSMPSAGRGYGGNADGAHVRSSTIGPWIEGCYYEAVGDDGVAIYAKGIGIRSQPAPGQVLLDEQFFNLKTGDKMMFFNPREGLPIGGDRVISNIKHADGGWLVDFSPALESPPATSYPDPWNNDQAFNMTARHEGFVVRRNTFRDIRRYGVIVRGQYGAIEENSFIGTSDSAITLQNEPYSWRNGLHSIGVRIANNRIEHCNFAFSARGRGAIDVMLRSLGDISKKHWSEKPAPWKSHREITIAGNSISDWRGCAISLQNIDGLILAGNRIVGERPRLPDAPPARAVFMDNVAGVSMADNVIEGLQPGTEAIFQGADVSMIPPGAGARH